MDMRRGRLVLVAALAWATVAAAQTPGSNAPSAQELIDQLKPPAASTRSLGLGRGFKVRQQADAASAAASDAGSAPSAPGGPAPTTPSVRPSVSLSIEFDFDSARVRPESHAVLANLAQAMSSDALLAAHFRIEGHTDASGRADYNQRLSAQRAEAVAAFLAARGVAAARLSSVGKGSSELADPAHPTAAGNRRVKIVNLE